MKSSRLIATMRLRTVNNMIKQVKHKDNKEQIKDNNNETEIWNG